MKCRMLSAAEIRVFEQHLLEAMQIECAIRWWKNELNAAA